MGERGTGRERGTLLGHEIKAISILILPYFYPSFLVSQRQYNLDQRQPSWTLLYSSVNIASSISMSPDRRRPAPVIITSVVMPAENLIGNRSNIFLILLLFVPPC